MPIRKKLRILYVTAGLCAAFLYINIQAPAHSAKFSEVIAETLFEKITSKDARVRLSAFDALGITEPFYMKLLTDAAEGAPCGIEELERFVFDDAVNSVIDVMRKRRAELPNAKKIQKECEMLMNEADQYGF